MIDVMTHSQAIVEDSEECVGLMQLLFEFCVTVDSPATDIAASMRYRHHAGAVQAASVATISGCKVRLLIPPLMPQVQRHHQPP
jgi:hypothetical protein